MLKNNFKDMTDLVYLIISQTKITNLTHMVKLSFNLVVPNFHSDSVLFQPVVTTNLVFVHTANLICVKSPNISKNTVNLNPDQANTNKCLQSSKITDTLNQLKIVLGPK